MKLNIIEKQLQGNVFPKKGQFSKVLPLEPRLHEHCEEKSVIDFDGLITTSCLDYFAVETMKLQAITCQQLLKLLFDGH